MSTSGADYLTITNIRAITPSGGRQAVAVLSAIAGVSVQTSEARFRVAIFDLRDGQCAWANFDPYALPDGKWLRGDDEDWAENVTGNSIGKGYAGVIKRHNFKTQDATHGNSLAHRAPGSIGQNQTPGRVFKGKKMAGRMGNVKKTIQNLEVIEIDTERNLIFIKGSIAGHDNSFVVITPSIKSKQKEREIFKEQLNFLS